MYNTVLRATSVNRTILRHSVFMSQLEGLKISRRGSSRLQWNLSRYFLQGRAGADLPPLCQSLRTNHWRYTEWSVNLKIPIYVLHNPCKILADKRELFVLRLISAFCDCRCFPRISLGIGVGVLFTIDRCKMIWHLFLILWKIISVISTTSNKKLEH